MYSILGSLYFIIMLISHVICIVHHLLMSPFVGYRASGDDMGAWKRVGEELGGVEGWTVWVPSDGGYVIPSSRDD